MYETKLEADLEANITSTSLPRALPELLLVSLMLTLMTLIVIMIATTSVMADQVSAITPPQNTQTKIVTPSEKRSDEIIGLLRQDCGACHGMTLQGGLGPSLLPESLQKLSQEDIAATISNGRPGTPMPPWKPFLKETEIRWLAQQLKQGIKDTK